MPNEPGDGMQAATKLHPEWTCPAKRGTGTASPFSAMIPERIVKPLISHSAIQLSPNKYRLNKSIAVTENGVVKFPRCKGLRGVLRA
jgi:hypothetical protein